QQLPVCPLETLHEDIVPGHRTLSRQTRLYQATFFSRLLAGRDLPAHASREQAVRQAEIRRLALVLGQARRDLKDNRAQLLAIVEDIAPGLTSRFGVARSAPRRPSSASPTQAGAAAKRPTPR
ncbi:MAG TPA: hypothetical protein VFP86_01385, partial [bacterium]|nr:hypothetical protein [bacterium]